MLKRPHYIAIGLIVAMTLTILNLPGQATARLKLGIGSIFLPLFGLANSSQRLVETAGDALLPRSELLRQNETLLHQNQQLLLQVTEAEKALQENEKLRRLLGYQQRSRLKLKLARVVLGEPSNWWRMVQIDAGSRDGITNNLPVLTPEGYLVGRISQVSFTRSQVLLLGDPNCKVAARVENPGGDTGVIGSSDPVDSRLVEMRFPSKSANFKSGQTVKTWGKGGIFPEGIPIGTIVDTHSDESGLSTLARVRLSANLSNLEEVWVRFP
jgi:rod shape-determining protein MreC